MSGQQQHRSQPEKDTSTIEFHKVRGQVTKIDIKTIAISGVNP